MKCIRPIILVLFFQFSFHCAFAQEVISEGKIIYEISFPDMELDSAYKALNPTGSTVYFKNNKSRTELTVGRGLHTATILDAENGDIITLTDMMGTKNAMLIEGKKEGKLKTNDKSKKALPEISYLDEAKEIAGYSCKKARIKTASTTNPVEVYFTDRINSIMQINRDWKDFKGFPLQYTLEMDGIVMMMTAISVSPEKVADSLFVIPADYTILTAEQMSKMMQGSEK